MTKEERNKKYGSKNLKYKPEDQLIVISALSKLGGTHEQIAEALKITPSTLYEWAKKYPEVSEALKKEKYHADSHVEMSLYKRALGYEYKEEKIISLPDGTTRKEVTKKQMAPDVTAQIFWLKNRRPREWRDKVDIKAHLLREEKKTIEVNLNYTKDEVKDILSGFINSGIIDDYIDSETKAH